MNSVTSTLVGVPELKAHLALLHAFANLKNHVENLEDGAPFPHSIPWRKERKWGWFVGLAVERFDSWCKALQPGDLLMSVSSVLPPVDVIMVWHSYLLNPVWLRDDSARIEHVRILRQLSSVVFRPANAQVLQEALQADTDSLDSRIEHWNWRMSLPFDPIESCKHTKTKTVSCPQCQRSLAVAFVNEEGTGFLQPNFTTKCEACGFRGITKETLILRRLADDICDVGHLFPGHDRDKYYLSYALKFAYFDSTVNSTKNVELRDITSPQCTPHQKEMVVQAIMRNADYKLVDVKHEMARVIRVERIDTMLGRLMSAYKDEKVYSVELLSAVLRQGTFVQKMHQLHWTYPGYFDNQVDELALHHAIARYQAFLHLISSSGSFCVPTLDIDLVWHTHQLNAEKYEADTKLYAGKFVNHDDKVEALKLSSAFDATCRAWKDKFDMPYHYCGCPLPGTTIGQRLKKLVSSTRSSSDDHDEKPPPPINLPTDPAPRALLIPATHPSDHNAVVPRPMNYSKYARAVGRAKYLQNKFEGRKRRERLEKAKEEKKKQKEKEKEQKEKGRRRRKGRESEKDRGGTDEKEEDGERELRERERAREERGEADGGLICDLAFLVPVPMEPTGSAVINCVGVGGGAQVQSDLTVGAVEGTCIGGTCGSGGGGCASGSCGGGDGGDGGCGGGD